MHDKWSIDLKWSLNREVATIWVASPFVDLATTECDLDTVKPGHLYVYIVYKHHHL